MMNAASERLADAHRSAGDISDRDLRGLAYTIQCVGEALVLAIMEAK